MNSWEEEDGSPNFPVLSPDGHHMLHLLHTLSHKRREILHIDSSVWPLPQLQPPLVLLAQQIPNLLLRHTADHMTGSRSHDMHQIT